ncbi:ATPase family associated with various cellular activities (AAA) [Nitrosospira sp. Nl5]|uniref:ATP-binding protein n=1 Tax=Nitrosospira sp. Nl5 TaxID=200120 RepID=UPI0008820396|nr:ATP-binding protein [Nitrosospira sp. Nl5]SCY10710.1 ATPase family associated with various cellular activities (AAA) [Nitrosospira sp. Nl5]
MSNKFSSVFQHDVAAIMSTVEGALAEDRQEQARPTDSCDSRFVKLCEVFRLTDAEIDMLRCLIAQSLDPTLSDKFEDRTGFAYVSELLLRQGFGHGIEPIYTSDSALNIWRLAHARDMGPSQPIAFELDLAVLEWLAGKSGLEPRLLRRLIRGGKASKAFSGLYDRELDRLTTALQTGLAQIVLLNADEGADIPDFLATLSTRLSLPVLTVRPPQSALSDQDIQKLHRFAKVQNAILFWAAPTLDMLVPALAPATHIQCVMAKRGLGLSAYTDLPRLTLHVPGPGRDRLSYMLKSRFPEATEKSIAKTVNIKGLTPNKIMDPSVENLGELIARQEAINAEALTDWAVPLKTNMRFDDLVLEPGLKKELRQLVGEIEAHTELWQNPEIARVYSQERALTVLLQGPPGTGKTLTARVLAGEAGLPLFRVDAASLTSKYIGETAENMRSLFRAANKSGTMLFIDEFEAIVGKRTETRNEIARSYNHDTAYFLQLIETQFEGVVVFASNRPMEIDEAMHRRIRKVFDFKLPDKGERKELWRLALVPFGVSSEVLQFADLLAESFSLSGSRIKAVVLNAHALGQFRQSGPDICSLRQAVLSEARSNGRLPSARELQRIESLVMEPRMGASS